MSSAFRKFSYLICVALFAQCGIATAQPSPSSEKAALDQVRSRLFRVVAGSAKDEKGGTAYLLKVANEDGKRFAYFATCFHVVHGCDTIDIYPTLENANQPGPAEANFAAGALDFKVRSVPTLDLVLLRAPTTSLGELEPPEAASDDLLPDGFVFGFPSFDSQNPYALSVRVAKGTSSALFQSFYQPGSAPSSPTMNIRFITREITYPGMSGGPVFENGKYVGMLLGRMPEPAAAPVLLSGHQVLKALAGPEWVAFDPIHFKVDLPYRKNMADRNGEFNFGQSMKARRLQSDLDWSSFEQWNAVLTDDPTSFLSDFQEVSVRTADLELVTGRHDPDPSLTFNNLGSLPNGQPAAGQHVKFIWNGQPKDPGEAVSLRPGENLLIVSKEMDNEGVLNDLFKPNPIEVELSLDGKPAFRVRRSLPALVRRYSIFVTVHHHVSIEDKAADEDYAARLAIRLDYLNGLVNRVPFRLPITGNHSNIGVSYDGAAEAGGQYFQLRYVSPQTLDADLTSTIDVNQFECRFNGVRIKVPQSGKGPLKYPLTMVGRVQFPAEISEGDDPALFFVSPRAHAARSGKALPLPLFGEDIEVDVGPVIRQALVSYVNKELLLPAKAAVPDRDQLNRLLEDAGVLSHMAGHSLRPLRAFVKREDGAAPTELDRIWAVLTFRLIGPDGRAIKSNMNRSLIPETDLRKTIGMEFVAYGLPISVSKPHFVRSDDRENKLVHEIINEDEGRVISSEKFRLAVPAGTLPPPRKTPLDVNAKAEQLGAAVGDVLRAAFVDSPKTVEARLAASAPLQLLGALPAGRRLLEANPQFKGQMRLDANINSPEGSTIKLRLAQPPFAIEWKNNVTLADEMTVTDLSLTFEQATADAELSSAAFKGSLAGVITAKRLVVGEYVFEPVEVRIASATVDSQQAEQLSLCLDVSGKRTMSDGSQEPVNIKGFRVKLGTATTADQAKKKLIKALLDSLLTVPDPC